MYRIYIDENLPHQLAEGLNILQEPQNKKDNLKIEVLSIPKQYGVGVKDEDWIPAVGADNGIVITQDYRIQSQKHQRELYTQHGVGILFINPPKGGMSYWETVKQVVKRWEEIKQIISRNKTPFAFKCNLNSQHFEKL